MKRHTLYIYIIGVILAVALFSCANPGSGPDGGPYDEEPPVIVKTEPAIGATNVHPKKITITFNELIKVENAQEKIVISPPQMEVPEIKVAGRHISVAFIDSLRPATTYTVDFSDAIVDSNEGNPLGNFTYYFSTGESVDTMEVSGYVLSADDLEPVKGINVGLHRDLSDSAFTTQPFIRMGRTDADGRFTIKGVARGDYRIYALKDMDGDYKYLRGEMLAFSRDTIRPACFADTRNDTLWADTVRIDTICTVPFTHFTPDDLVLLAFTEKNNQRQFLKSTREPHYFSLFFTAPSKHVPEVRGLNFDDRNAWVRQCNRTNDSLTYWLKDSVLVNNDSLKIELRYEAVDDSTGLNVMKTDTLELVPKLKKERRDKLEATAYEKWQKQQEKRKKQGLKFETEMPRSPLEVKYEIGSTLSPDNNIYFRPAEPLAKMDTTLFHLYLKVDTLYKEAPFRIERDTLDFLRYRLRAEWRPSQEYVINIDSAAMTGLLGKVNATHDSKFRIKKMEEVGALFLLIPESEANAVVQLIDGSGKIVKQQPVKSGRVDFFYVEPGSYYLKLFNDLNGNGRIDEGAYSEGRNAEKVYYFPEKIQIRANWDLEQVWNLNTLPIYRQKPRELIKQKTSNVNKITPKMRNAEREAAKRKG